MKAELLAEKLKNLDMSDENLNIVTYILSGASKNVFALKYLGQVIGTVATEKQAIAIFTATKGQISYDQVFHVPRDPGDNTPVDYT